MVVTSTLRCSEKEKRKMTEKNFKKGQRVRWCIGRATTYSDGKVERFFKAGTKVPGTVAKKLKTKTFDAGYELERDKVLVETNEDGTLRLISPGYLERY
jgi:hypothetical protein